MHILQGDKMPNTIPIQKWKAQKTFNMKVEEQSLFTRKHISQFCQNLHDAGPLLPTIKF